MSPLVSPPVIYVNGVRLTGVKVHEEHDMSGVYVRAVHIDAPSFDISERDGAK